MASGNFETCLKLLLKDEGGWVDHDPRTMSPPTNKGITLDQFRKWHQNMGVHPCITLLGSSDLRSMSEQDVAKFYWQTFWRPLCGEQLPAGLDYAVFDAAVMSGQGDAVKWLQDALGVKADGVIGPVTLAAAAQATNSAVQKLCAARLDYLKHLMHFKDNPGWGPRVQRVEQAACKMLDRPVEEIEDEPAGALSIPADGAGAPTQGEPL